MVTAEEGALSCTDSAPKKDPRADSHRELGGAKTGERSDKKRAPMCLDAVAVV